MGSGDCGQNLFYLLAWQASWCWRFTLDPLDARHRVGLQQLLPVRCEVGVRLALGAAPGQILNWVLGGALRLAGPGIVLGLGGALLLSRALQSLLQEVRGVDSLAFGGTSLILVLASLAASFWPARRAAHTDPTTVLRGEL